MDLNPLRRNIGVVLQDTFIFGGTVAENIALGDPEPDMQAVLEAAKMAGSEDFIINSLFIMKILKFRRSFSEFDI